MRAAQLFPRTHYHPDQTIYVAVIPVRCRCVAPVMKNRYTHFRNLLGVKVNGLLIGDAEARAVTYTDGYEAVVEFTGSVVVFAAKVTEALRNLKRAEVEVFGWVNGFAHDVEIDAIGEVNLVNALDGNLNTPGCPN